MPTLMQHEYRRELDEAIVALREHSRDLRSYSAGLSRHSRALREKSGRLLVEYDALLVEERATRAA